MGESGRARFKVPRYIEFRDSLPHTSSGSTGAHWSIVGQRVAHPGDIRAHGGFADYTLADASLLAASPTGWNQRRRLPFPRPGQPPTKRWPAASTSARTAPR
ncbi:hypothetical protein ACFXKG_00925 [Streptomyces sp. NPDC059255]|uniref:hypothetical protein n=1 Tax=Streptomyces sp. NPDC059255 TaxID=3346793 RepID=UPI0036964B82